jgi:hypothetical protein
MKIVYTLTFFLVMAFAAKGQGNLQFSTAKFIRFEKTFPSTGGVNYQFFDSLFVVPAGKVWKLESSGSSSDVSGAESTFANSRIDGVAISSASRSNTAKYNFPIWLPTGTYKFGISAIPLSGSEKVSAYFSILEFNIVQ